MHFLLKKPNKILMHNFYCNFIFRRFVDCRYASENLHIYVRVILCLFAPVISYLKKVILKKNNLIIFNYLSIFKIQHYWVRQWNPQICAAKGKRNMFSKLKFIYFSIDHKKWLIIRISIIISFSINKFELLNVCSSYNRTEPTPPSMQCSICKIERC